MANGFQGTREEWDRLEAPLIAIDQTLEEFADQHSLTLTKNHKHPERSLKWGSPVSRLIQVFVSADEIPAFNLWLCASEDRGRDRFWKQEFLLESVTEQELSEGLEPRLAQAHRIVESWQPKDLEFATHILS